MQKQWKLMQRGLVVTRDESGAIGRMTAFGNPADLATALRAPDMLQVLRELAASPESPADLRAKAAELVQDIHCLSRQFA